MIVIRFAINHTKYQSMCSKNKRKEIFFYYVVVCVLLFRMPLYCLSINRTSQYFTFASESYEYSKLVIMTVRHFEGLLKNIKKIEITTLRNTVPYSILISFPFGFIFLFLSKVTSSIPLLYVDLAVSISASFGISIFLWYFFEDYLL